MEQYESSAYVVCGRMLTYADVCSQVAVGEVEQYESLLGFLGRDGGVTGSVRAALRVAARAAAPPQVSVFVLLY